MEIIPAIDMIDGHCVRLSKGDYDTKKIYNENPLEVARMFEDNGIRRLHLVDLDGAKAGHIVNHRVLESIATHTSLVIDFGGGLKKLLDDVRAHGKQGLSVYRFKGLGEMDAEELFDTTMNPAKRRMLRVKLEDAVAADRMFSLLMGDEVEPRRKFIEDNALNVKNLDF